MKKRQYLIIGVNLLFFGMAILFQLSITKEANLVSYAQRIERYLQKNEAEVMALLSDDEFIQWYWNGIKKLAVEEQKKAQNHLQQFSDKPYNVCFYQNDSLVFWLNNRVLPDKKQLNALLAKPEMDSLFELDNGYYQIIKKPIEKENGNRGFFLGLIPIHHNYLLESDYLKNRFLAQDFSIPKAIVLSDTPTSFPVKTKEGKALFWIKAKMDFKDKSQQRFLLIMYLLAFISLAILINDLAIILVKKYRPWIGAAFLIATVFGIRILSVQLGFSSNFSDLQTFSETFNTPVLNSNSSLGDLLINIVLLLWMMVFFHREFHVKEFVNIYLPIRYGLTVLNYFSIILGILMITGVFKSLVLDSQITFDFDNVFNLDFYSFLAIIGAILLLFALFLFGHRMMLTIVKIGLTKYQRLLAFIIATLASIPVILYADLKLPILQLILVGIIYIGLFDIFIESKSPTFSWLIIWLVIFAAFSSGLLYKYNSDNDFQLLEDYAVKLSSFNDERAEESLDKLKSAIESDEVLGRVADEWKGTSPFKDTISGSLDNFYIRDKYLFQNYTRKEADFFIKEEISAANESEDSIEEWQRQYKEAKPTKYNGLRLQMEANQIGAYLLQSRVGKIHPLRLFLRFEPKPSNPSKVYTELLLDKQFKGIQNLEKYDYAIYKNGRLVQEKGKFHDKILSDSLPQEGESRKVMFTSVRSELLYRAANGVVVKIGKNLGGYLKPISLFSYLFCLLVITVILLASINTFTQALPASLRFSISQKPSLRTRIQFWVITLVLVFFLMIGFVTVWHFQQSSNSYHHGKVEEIIQSTRKDAEHEIKLLFEQKNKNTDFASMVQSFSDIHQMDVNLYDLEGNLSGSSAEDIFKAGIVAPKMGSEAFQALAEMGQSRKDQEERIGELDYITAYMPLKLINGKVEAYLGLPYYSQQRDLRNDVTEFMGTLLNVYVFLLIIAGVIAITVANSVTKPISDLGDSLKRMKLGKNEPLVWNSKDELGELIAEYNRMLKKIEESAKLLVQSEREGAWRKMAKRVAHEIKNPLTPMKLSIQYMLRAYQSNPNNIEPLLNRVSQTLIEQIDSLSQIASEFSNFAKMPKPVNSKFLLNDLAASVHGLFGTEGQRMEISLYLPDKQFFVRGDKNHLTRVLTNLLKNATQAIPDTRKGEIDIRLSQKNNTVIIKISDNGMGIDSKMREMVFVPNFTTKTSGTGLGLAICKDIIESFKGRIYFKTKVGQGTEFFVELPLAEVKPLPEV